MGLWSQPVQSLELQQMSLKTGRNSLNGALAAFPQIPRASLVAQLEKNPPAVQETLVQYLGWKDLLEKG